MLVGGGDDNRVTLISSRQPGAAVPSGPCRSGTTDPGAREICEHVLTGDRASGMHGLTPPAVKALTLPQTPPSHEITAR
jgi:hypothetical protein